MLAIPERRAGLRLRMRMRKRALVQKLDEMFCEQNMEALGSFLPKAKTTAERVRIAADAATLG
jgi:hypothetical protein